MPPVWYDRFSDCDKLCDPSNGYSVSCSKLCPDMPHAGNDGFTDCDKLCDSGNGYSVSCENICPDFKIPTETQTISTVTIEHGYKAPVEVTFDLTSLATVIGCVIAAAVIFLMVYCLRHTIRKLWQRWRKRFIKMSVQEQQHRSTAVKELIAAESGTMQQQPESNIPINIPPNETDRLLLQVKGEVSNEMAMLPPLEMDNPEKNLKKITPDQKQTSNGDVINKTLKRSGPDPDHDEYVDIQSIRTALDPVYANVSESQNRDGQDPRQINNSLDSINTTNTVFENGDDITYEEGSDVGSSERAGMTLVIVTEMR